jgi:hypothetical protein
MLSSLPTNTEVELELADGTRISGLRTNGTNFVSDVPVSDSVFENNLSLVKIITPERVEEYHDLKLIQNRQFGEEYMFVLAEKNPAEREREELLQLIADLAELMLEVLDNG